MMPIPASTEQIKHHASQHECDAEPIQRLCPCGNALVLICAKCDELLFLVLLGKWCKHAEQLAGVKP